MNIKLKVIMDSGEIYYYYFDVLSNTAAFAKQLEEFLLNNSSLINDSIESMSVVVSDGITEMSIIW